MSLSNGVLMSGSCKSGMTMERVRAMLKVLMNGGSKMDACRATGVHVWTIYNWARQGKYDLGKGLVESPYAKFTLAVDSAQDYARRKAWARVSGEVVMPVEPELYCDEAMGMRSVEVAKP